LAPPTARAEGPSANNRIDGPVIASDSDAIQTWVVALALCARLPAEGPAPLA